ncbi:MAG: fumarate hydratase [Bacillota bacterium]
MKTLRADKIRDAVRDLCMQAAIELPGDVAVALLKAKTAETSPLGREILGALLENARLSKREKIPLCQDTGVTYVFLELGQDLHVVGGDVTEAVTAGVSEGYTQGFLRKSVVRDPLFDRTNTGDNTPPIIHTEIVPGGDLTITVLPKGTGSENMGGLAMLTPAAGPAGVSKFVLDTVAKGAANACPPLVVGVGVGGMMDTAAYLAKKALLRPVGISNPDPKVAQMEEDILSRINELGIGPAGLGGVNTALAVHIETHPTHIGALPVAVNLQCHAARRASVTLKDEEVGSE